MTNFMCATDGGGIETKTNMKKGKINIFTFKNVFIIHRYSFV